jgi:hypothetical protein
MSWAFVRVPPEGRLLRVENYHSRYAFLVASSPLAEEAVRFVSDLHS